MSFFIMENVIVYDNHNWAYNSKTVLVSVLVCDMATCFTTWDISNLLNMNILNLHNVI